MIEKTILKKIAKKLNVDVQDIYACPINESDDFYQYVYGDDALMDSDIEVDYNEVVEKGYISPYSRGNDAFVMFLELLSNFSLYEGEEWSDKVRNLLQDEMNDYYGGVIESNYGERFESVDEIPQWCALELLQTQIFRKLPQNGDVNDAIIRIGRILDIDFNESPFAEYVEGIANMDSYYDDIDNEMRDKFWHNHVRSVSVDGEDYYVYVE